MAANAQDNHAPLRMEGKKDEEDEEDCKCSRGLGRKETSSSSASPVFWRASSPTKQGNVPAGASLYSLPS